MIIVGFKDYLKLKDTYPVACFSYGIQIFAFTVQMNSFPYIFYSVFVMFIFNKMGVVSENLNV